MLVLLLREEEGEAVRLEVVGEEEEGEEVEELNSTFS